MPIEIRNAKNLVNEDTRICALVMAGAKQGKTEFASSLNEVTLKYRGKKTLIIGSEVAEGGGVMTLHGRDIDFYEPKNWQDFESTLAQMATDEQYGGIVLDNATDYVERIVKPHVLKYPSKEENTKFGQTRQLGVLGRSDYQTQAEFARGHLARLIEMTRDRTDARYRKDLIVTVLERDLRKPGSEEVVGYQPGLPGALSGSVTAMFQSVLTIKKATQVIDAGKPTARRVDVRTLHSGGDPLRDMLGDRTGLFPIDSPLTGPDGRPLGMLALFEQWRSRMAAAKAA